MKVAPELIHKWLSNVKVIQNRSTDDHETLACIKHLRKIYIHNNNRIKELDGNGSCDILNTITKEQYCDSKRICRVATPSPTPEDEPVVEGVGDNQEFVSNDERDRGMKSILLPTSTRDVDHCKDYNGIDSGQRKRKRCAIISNKCTIN